MPLTLELIQHDDIYHKLTTDKILLNHIDIFNTETKKVVDEYIIKTYSEDNLSVIPSCLCGDLKGAYYMGEPSKRICPRCHTRVASSVDDDISFLLWVEKPVEVEKFISPIILSILLNRYKITKPNVPLIKYLLFPNYAIDRRQQKKNMELLHKLDFLLKANNIKRGYNSFVQNFFKIIEILEAEFVKDKLSEKTAFMNFLINNQFAIFSNYLPFPNKVMFAMDSNELGKFIDKSLLSPINVIRRLTGIDLYTKPSQVKQLKVAKSLVDMAEFYPGYMKTSFFSKLGLLRRHTSSTRNYFTARAVVTSIRGPHAYDEIHLPWSLSCSLFREHILNRLYKRGYSYKKAINFLIFHNRAFHPILAEIFTEIVNSVPGGIRCLFGRNPSLHLGSIQRVRITMIKFNNNCNSISTSYLIAKNFNMDFDGEENHIAVNELVNWFFKLL